MEIHRDIRPTMPRATALMKLIARGEEDIRAGRVSDQDGVLSEMRERIKKRRDAGAPGKGPSA